MADVEFVTEIRIAAYWRKQLGEYEYVGYNADDLRRWYIAMETRGPEEIRDFLVERSGRFPRDVISGIVATAPHPPLSIVELWLDSHRHVSLRSYWLGLAVFCLASVLVGENLQGCAQLRDVNRLDTNPAQMNAPLPAGSPGPLPPAGSTLPNPGIPPANVASPSATGSSAQHH